MTRALPPPTVSLRAIFGARVPADANSALAMFHESPLAPTDAAALAALRAAVLEHIGRQLEDVERAAKEELSFTYRLPEKTLNGFA